MRVFKKILKGILLLVLAGAVVGVGFVAGALSGMIRDTSQLDVDKLSLSMDFTTMVYSVDPDSGEATELERLYDDENRIWVDIEQIPKNLQDAFVAIEDERFFHHKGVDLKRTLGATMKYLFRSESSYGGSTITQQFIKNITGDDDVTPKRKIQEMYRAYSLERKLSKEEILELYLNTIYLSQHCNGVQAAANVYFGKDVSELSLAESASLAGITQYPSKYDPFVNPEANKEKQEVVLKKMLELGKISQSEYDSAVKAKLKFNQEQVQEKLSNKQSYFVDALIDDVIVDLQEKGGYSKAFAQKLLYSGGLKIYATIDPEIQSVMDKVYQDDSLFPSGRNGKEVESAMVLMDPYNGEIKALVGGRGEKQANRVLNRATQTLRQPGSTIKPVSVYGPAIEYGVVDIDSNVLDAPINVNGWKPKNQYSGFRGQMTIRRAIALSANLPAVRTLQKLGVDLSFDFMTQNLGITSLVDHEEINGKDITDRSLAPLALGGLTHGVSVKELTAAYAPFINSGIYTTPHTYTKITDKDGNLVLENNGNAKVAMSEYTAYAMNQLLQGVVNNGTGTAARFSSMPLGGKTGTTSDDNDRWYVGYSPYYVSAVWVGYDTPQTLDYISGINPALRLWRAVNSEIHEDLEIKKFGKYEGENRNTKLHGDLVKKRICSSTGLLAGKYCGDYVITETFTAETVPTEYCNVHSSSHPGYSRKSEDDDDEDEDKKKKDDDDDDDEDDASGSSKKGNSKEKSSGSEKENNKNSSSKHSNDDEEDD